LFAFTSEYARFCNLMTQFSWYLDITPNEIFSLYDYPIRGKDGLPLCKLHGKKLEMLEVLKNFFQFEAMYSL